MTQVFLPFPSTDSVFSRSTVEMIRKVPSMESEWNSLLSPWITSLPFPDLRSRMARTIPSIESNWYSLLSSSDKSLSFLDQSSAMCGPILPIVSNRSFLFSPLTKSLFFLNPLSRWFEQSCRCKVSKIHISASLRKYLSFPDPRSAMISTLSAIESEWNSFVSPRLNLSFPDPSSSMIY